MKIVSYLLMFLIIDVCQILADQKETHVIVPESVYKLIKPVDEILFPEISPFDEGHLKVSHIHSIWYAQYGNPNGIPVVFVHGGPGAGCGPNDMRFFDPKFYRIILIDQRGAPRSIPAAEIQENTTPLLIQDMETVRKHLQIKQWVLFGGSWGSTLSLAYGEAHPEACLGFVLRGIFLGTEEEYKQLWYGMKDVFPAEWEEMSSFIPESERSDLMAAYYKRFTHKNLDVQYAAGRVFTKYDLTASLLNSPKDILEKLLNDKKFILSLSRIFTHFCMNKFYFEKNQIIENLASIHHLPCIIVHGRYDMICRLQAAYKLHKAWKGSQLVIVPDAGHSASEPGTAKALVEATEHMKTLIKVG